MHCYALDVGYNQLAWKIRQDSRVTVMERTNFRHATPELFTAGVPQFATIDVSFISLTLILPALKRIIAQGGDVIALVKPQFEAGKGKVGKKGVVREKSVHFDVLKKLPMRQYKKDLVYVACHSPLLREEKGILNSYSI